MAGANVRISAYRPTVFCLSDHRKSRQNDRYQNPLTEQDLFSWTLSLFGSIRHAGGYEQTLQRATDKTSWVMVMDLLSLSIVVRSRRPAFFLMDHQIARSSFSDQSTSSIASDCVRLLLEVSPPCLIFKPAI